MDKPIISIKNLGKKYSIDHMRGKYVALRDVIVNVLKNPFGFALDKAKQATGLSKKEEFWALKDVNLEIMPGEVIGIIGPNGAGKSTLLKILSQITPPSTGEIKLRGRVGSLLEVGTGFHPELTGRENIMLNGAILGMTRKEISRKFDQIVEFSGVEKFLDTPVKHYSSGMYVRLAFSVAAHLEPDILIVDEVLAVGDAEFQKKCLGKMEEITRATGRTILFVSHNLSAVEALCTKCVLLKNGKVKTAGNTKEVIDEYYRDSGVSAEFKGAKRKGQQDVKIMRVELTDREGKKIGNLTSQDNINLLFELHSQKDFSDPVIDISVCGRSGIPVILSRSNAVPGVFRGSNTFLVELGSKLARGDYRIDLTLHAKAGDLDIMQDHIVNALTFFVSSGAKPDPSWMESAVKVNSNIKAVINE